MTSNRRHLCLFAAVACLTVGVPDGLGAQARCGAGVIAEVVVEVEKPLGPDSGAASDEANWLFRTMNFFHIRTRERTVRWELLFDEGDCLDPVVVAESERSLRNLRFVSEATIVVEPLDVDGEHRVHVRVRDSWALTGGLALSLDGGVAITGVSANARNVFGTGTRLGLFRTVFRERRRVGLIVRQPNLLGTRIDAALHGGETRSGDYFDQSIFRPFAGEVGSNAFRQVARERDDYFSYSLDPASGYTQAMLRFEEERYELTAQRRWEVGRGVRLVTGVGVSREDVRFPFGDAGVLLVGDDAFGDPAPATDGIRTEIRGQSRDHRVTRLDFTVGVRDVTFGSIAALDALAAAQDVFTGGTLTFTAAPALFRTVGAPSDVLLRAQAAWGRRAARTYLRLRGDVQSRRVGGSGSGAEPGPEAAPAGWRDLVYEIEARGYLHAEDGTRVFTRLSYAAGYSLDRPFQLTLGGREGVRGYDDDAYPAARRLLATVEHRFPVPRISTKWADLGVAVFADAGRGWAGSVPFGEDSGWRAGVGVGLRMGLPAGAASVLRVDLGVPVTGERATRGVVLRVYTELFGLLDRRAWPNQVERSRWYGSDPDLTSRPYDPLAGN